MHKHSFLVILLLSSLLFSNTKQSPIQKSQCGINALYMCLRYHQVDVSLDQAYAEIQPNKKNEVSLYQLSQYAKDFGLYVVPVKRPEVSILKQALTNSSSAILQFTNPSYKSHIIALLKPKNQDIWLVDVPLRNQILSDDELQELLNESQGMLIISPTPLKNISFHKNNSKLFWIIFTTASLIVFIIATLSCIYKGQRRKMSAL